MIEILIMTVFVGTVVTIVSIVCCGFYMYVKKFKNAHIVVKQDDRIIECNGMMIPMQCKKCRFGRVNEDSVECFAPDYDGTPVIGLTR